MWQNVFIIFNFYLKVFVKIKNFILKFYIKFKKKCLNIKNFSFKSQAIENSPEKFIPTNFVASTTESSTTNNAPLTTLLPSITKSAFQCTGKPDGYYYKGECSPTFVICSKGNIFFKKR